MEGTKITFCKLTKTGTTRITLIVKPWMSSQHFSDLDLHVCSIDDMACHFTYGKESKEKEGQ